MASIPASSSPSDPAHASSAEEDPLVMAAVRELVDEYRARCLWFLRPDYYPTHPAEIGRVLDAIGRAGDVTAHRRVAALRTWLSRLSSAPSAG